MLQLILHLLGDYLLQSEAMAACKRNSSAWAGFHAVTYALPFWLLQPSWSAWAVICASHFLIDRCGLARHVIWAKNIVLGLWPKWLCRTLARPKPASAAARASRLEEWGGDCRRLAWSNCKATGYPADLEPWLAATLLMIADNTIHLLINWSALSWL